jgi:hypothetical protein
MSTSKNKITLEGENKGINVMLRRYGYVDKKTLQSKV